MLFFRYKSLIGTIGKKFATKRKRAEVADSPDEDGSESEKEESTSPKQIAKSSQPNEKSGSEPLYDKSKKGKKAYRFMRKPQD